MSVSSIWVHYLVQLILFAKMQSLLVTRRFSSFSSTPYRSRRPALLCARHIVVLYDIGRLTTVRIATVRVVDSPAKAEVFVPLDCDVAGCEKVLAVCNRYV